MTGAEAGQPSSPLPPQVLKRGAGAPQRVPEGPASGRTARGVDALRRHVGCRAAAEREDGGAVGRWCWCHRASDRTPGTAPRIVGSPRHRVFTGLHPVAAVSRPRNRSLQVGASNSRGWC